MITTNSILLWLTSSIVLFLTAKLVPGFTIKSFPKAMLAALVVGFLNALVKPVLIFLTLPINILTFGLFTFVVNAVILRLAAGILKGFDIKGWSAALIGAVMMAIINMVFLLVFGN